MRYNVRILPGSDMATIELREERPFDTTAADAYLTDLGRRRGAQRADMAILRWMLNNLQPNDTIHLNMPMRRLMAKELGISPSSVTGSLTRLFEGELIERDYYGVYRPNRKLIPFPDVLNNLTEVITTTRYVQADNFL